MTPLTIDNVAAVLRRIHNEARRIGVDDSYDVRLRVLTSAPVDWEVLWGDAQYDTDHRGYWGASYMPNPQESEELDAEVIARELIEEVEGSLAEEGLYISHGEVKL